MAGELKLGLNTGYWAGGPPPGVTESIAEAERLGFDSIWTAEAYGSDCLTPLAWWGAATERIKLGTAIVQMSARQPAATAMAAMTMDHLSGGRFILGLGVSGPQVVEGWYGMPFAKPLARTREYIGDPARHLGAQGAGDGADGEHYPLPLPGGTGLAKPLKSSIHPLREDIPIYLGAEGPKNIALCAELCDGWLAMLFSPDASGRALHGRAARRASRREGARRSVGGLRGRRDGAADRLRRRRGARPTALRPFYALYFGGMGAKGTNFHANVAIRMGYEREVDEIQELYLERQEGRGGREDPDAS